MKLASLFITFFSITLFQLQAQTAYPFLEKNKWYFVDTNLKKIDKIIYEEIIPAENNFFYLRKKTNLLWQIILENKLQNLSSTGFIMTGILD